MKKFILIGAATLIVSNTTFAGDYLTNTNQHAAFLRMVARGASIDVTVYTATLPDWPFWKKTVFICH